MKIKLLPFLLWICLFTACQDKESITLELSKTSYEINDKASALVIDITSNSEWTVASNADWCTVNTPSGSNNDKITINIEANYEAESRAAEIIFNSGTLSKSLSISQDGSYHYKIPVIFHVLYADEKDPLQYVRVNRLKDILAKCNAYYRAKTAPESPNMNLEFVLATETPQGVALVEAGVERIKIAEPELDCIDFMNDELPNSDFYVSKLWDLNKYINVFVYSFISDEILGVSNMPFTPEANPLEGLHASDYFFTKPMFYTHCVSINTKYIYEESKGNNYTALDVNVTLAHELGHYLGLHHTFTEIDVKDKNGNTIETILDACQDTDYCSDTPTYNSVEYENWLINYYETTPQANRDLSEVTVKYNCNGTQFTAHNIMDYAFCYSDQFTKDQRKRIRHVLNNSPIIPGPKTTRATSRSVDTEVPPIIFKILKAK